MDGAVFRIVLVDESQGRTPPAESSPSNSSNPPPQPPPRAPDERAKPEPSQQEPKPSKPDPTATSPTATSAQPVASNTDRSEHGAENRATPAHAQADRHNSKEESEEKKAERLHDHRVEAVKKGAEEIIEPTHLIHAFKPIIDAFHSTMHVARGVFAAQALVRERFATPKREEPAKQPAEVKQPEAAKPEPPAVREQSPAPEQEKPSPSAVKPEAVAKPAEVVSVDQPAIPEATKPETNQPDSMALEAITTKAKPDSPAPIPAAPKPENPDPEPKPEIEAKREAVKQIEQPDNYWDKLLAGISKLFDEPKIETAKAENPVLREIDRNTDPRHGEIAASRIVSAIEQSGKSIEQQGTVTKPDDSPSPPPSILLPEASAPEQPPKTSVDVAAVETKTSQEVAISEVAKPAEKQDDSHANPLQAAKKVAEKLEAKPPAIEAAPARAIATEGAVATEGAAAVEGATVAAEGMVALEGAGVAAGEGLAAVTAAMGPVGVAAAAVAAGFAAVGVAAFAVYKAFDLITDAAERQADELEGYSGAIAEQRAETQVRREVHKMHRAEERGETLARVGESKDKLEEAIHHLQDAVTDRFVDFAERMIPMIEALTWGIEKTYQTVDVIGTTTGVIEKTIIDWLNLMGDEAQEDAMWRDAWAAHSKAVEKLMKASIPEKDYNDDHDPMMQVFRAGRGNIQRGPNAGGNHGPWFGGNLGGHP